MATSVDIVLPVLNEENDLPPSTLTLYEFLSNHLKGYDWRIVIADNGSTDSTLPIAKDLSAELANVGFIALPERGRGRAQSRAWLESEADILAYMDVDLSADLNALPGLLSAIDVDGYDLAIGSRLIRGSKVVGRPLHREVISRGYSLLVRSIFLKGFRLLDIIDYQCGFKAISRRAARELVPMVRDTGWFFDSELLLLAKSNGFRVKEMPIKWTDDPDSRVKIATTAYEDLRGLLRLRFGGLRAASRALDTRRAGHDT